MNKRILTFVLTALLVMGSVAPVLAEDTESAASDGDITITGAYLTYTVAPFSLEGVLLDGTAQESETGESPPEWTFTDARGTGAGWIVQIKVDDFEYQDGSTTDTIAINENFWVQMDDIDITVADESSSAKPVSKVNGVWNSFANNNTTISIAETDEAGHGMGSYTLKPSFKLEVPASAYAGTYEATVTVTITQPDPGGS